MIQAGFEFHYNSILAVEKRTTNYNLLGAYVPKLVRKVFAERCFWKKNLAQRCINLKNCLQRKISHIPPPPPLEK